MYRVLQIEDLPSDAYLVRREVKKVLDSCEFQVVDDEDTFKKVLLEFKPDIILSDFSIPGFDWRNALNFTIEHAPQTPFIVVTGLTSEVIRNQCMTAGATDFVCKNAIRDLGPMILKVLK